MGDLKDDGAKSYRGGISVFACQSDTTHPTVLMLAKANGTITEERYKELTNVPKGTKPLLDNLELGAILEEYFGFSGGFFETHECMQQISRMGVKVMGEYRYTGTEREDKAWLKTRMASPEVKELSKYGGIVTMDYQDGVGELNIDDVLTRNPKEDY